MCCGSPLEGPIPKANYTDLFSLRFPAVNAWQILVTADLIDRHSAHALGFQFSSEAPRVVRGVGIRFQWSTLSRDLYMDTWVECQPREELVPVQCSVRCEPADCSHPCLMPLQGKRSRYRIRSSSFEHPILCRDDMTVRFLGFIYKPCLRHLQIL